MLGTLLLALAAVPSQLPPFVPFKRTLCTTDTDLCSCPPSSSHGQQSTQTVVETQRPYCTAVLCMLGFHPLSSPSLSPSLPLTNTNRIGPTYFPSILIKKKLKSCTLQAEFYPLCFFVQYIRQKMIKTSGLYTIFGGTRSFFKILVEFIGQTQIGIEYRPNPWAGRTSIPILAYFHAFLNAAAIPIFLTSSSHSFTKFLSQAARKRVKYVSPVGSMIKFWMNTFWVLSVNDRKYVFHFRPKPNIWPEKTSGLRPNTEAETESTNILKQGGFCYISMFLISFFNNRNRYQPPKILN